MSNNLSLINLFGLDQSLKIKDRKRVNKLREEILQRSEILHLQVIDRKEDNFEKNNRKLNKWNKDEWKSFLVILTFSSFTYLYLTKFLNFFKSTQSLIVYKPLCIFTFSIAPIVVAYNLIELNIKLRLINKK
jgi:hypothetical protein